MFILQFTATLNFFLDTLCPKIASLSLQGQNVYSSQINSWTSRFFQNELYNIYLNTTR